VFVCIHTHEYGKKKIKLKKHTQRQRHAVKRNEINKCVGTVEEIKTSLRERDGLIYNNNNNNSVKENQGEVE